MAAGSLEDGADAVEGKSVGIKTGRKCVKQDKVLLRVKKEKKRTLT